jgi:hypothetical protein
MDNSKTETCSRRDVLAALAKYSAGLGGAAATIVTADGLVSAASAYWSDDKLARFCSKNPTHWKCPGAASSSNGGSNDKRVNF